MATPIKRHLILLDLTATENGLLRETAYKAMLGIAVWASEPLLVPLSEDEYETIKKAVKERNLDKIEMTINIKLKDEPAT